MNKSAGGQLVQASCLYLSLLVVEFVDHKAGAEFGLKPCGLRRHDVACVGNVDQLIHCHGIKCKCHLHLAGVYSALQLLKSADTPYEVDTVV